MPDQTSKDIETVAAGSWKVLPETPWNGATIPTSACSTGSG